jgi:hypothetical protein
MNAADKNDLEKEIASARLAFRRVAKKLRQENHRLGLPLLTMERHKTAAAALAIATTGRTPRH